MSSRKVAEALGISSQTVRYWRDKKFKEELKRCDRCKNLQPKLDLVRKKSGWRFLRY